MSFDDFALRSSGKTGDDDRSAQTHVTLSFENQVNYNRLKDSINIQVFKINSNVQGINRLADKLGKSQDNVALQTSLTNLTASTRNMIEKSRADIQSLAAMNMKQAGQTMDQATENKLTKELVMAISSFQKAQELCAKKQKLSMEYEQIKLSELLGADGPMASSMSTSNVAENTRDQMLNQTYDQDVGVTSGAIAFQENLILDRERDIRDIETGIQELNEVFHDLNKMIGAQGEMIEAL
ncbi:hypothetical protein QFC21_002101 [Naganishia friedmannii]|uniref:Uncharacterized protein n=1 Tax=Naganishia friedmannii TaxID=89922 RepID=A0ACC2VYY8_9TREE|nr:hypothetical protein QFC21_002101 [Naganishia friedmannii]